MKKLTLVILSSISIAACTGPSPSSYLPDRGLTTQQAYEMHMAGEIGGSNTSNSSSTNSPWNATSKINILPAFDASLSTSISNELSNFKQDFTVVHNPEIVAYTYPTIDANGNPVAGHFSMFQLYDRDHYALTESEGMIYSQQ